MLTVSLIAGLALTLMAPYGTFQLPWPLRLTYWVGLTAMGGIGASLMDRFAHKKGLGFKPLDTRALAVPRRHISRLFNSTRA